MERLTRQQTLIQQGRGKNWSERHHKGDLCLAKRLVLNHTLLRLKSDQTH